jgi:hypothetical protein
MSKIRLHLTVFVVCLGAALTLRAGTYRLEPSADARIISYGGTLDRQNYATDFLSIYTSTNDGNLQRTLMQFDLSGIVLAGNERVGSAVLTLVASTAYGGNPGVPMEVYRVLAPWNEQSLTWLQRISNVPWSTPGGDFVGEGGQAYATSTNSPATDQQVSWDVTGLVDEWVEQVNPNYGLLLRSYNHNGLTFIQRESPNTNSRPALTVTSTAGLPRLKAAVDQTTGQFVLSWRGVGFAVLQESAALAGNLSWSDSSLVVTPQAGVSVVRVSSSPGSRFFRLRSL